MLNKYNLSEIKDVKELYPLYKEIHRILMNKEFEEINNIFKNIELEKVTVLILMGLLRLTYPWKANISYWEEHLLNVKEELKRRDKDYNSILVGLIKKEDKDVN